MKKNTLLLLVSVMVFLLISCVCQAEEKITWLRSDFPPFSIPSGPYTDKGSCDHATLLLIDKLDDYKSVVVLSNYNCGH